MHKYSEIEKKWQRRWEEEKIFYADAEIETESEIDQDQKKKFFLTAPYPYTSGPLHIGHGRTYTIADIIARFKRLQGYNVLFPMGFHVTGTPILAIADGIAKGEEEVIERYKDYVAIYADADADADPDPERVEAIVKTFDKPEIVADFFAEQIAADFKMMGYSIDWRRKFNTTEPFYKKFIEWQFKKLYEIGAIKRGKYPITFSIEDDCAVGEDDIGEGDIDKVSVVEYTAIKFKLSDQDQDQDTSNTYLIAATLRPETIFGVTNLWVNPDARYVNVKVGDEFWIMSKEALEKLSYQREDVKILEGEGEGTEIDGNALLWKQVKEPVADREIPILPASFVDTDVGTGLVYSVPAHAPYDYIGLEDLRKREGVGVGVVAVPVPVPEPIKIIEIEGYEQYEFPAREICKKMGIKDANDARLEEATQILYKDEFYRGVLNEKCKDFKGLKIAAIKDEVKTWLNMAEIFYETSRKAVTRAGGKVIVAVLQDQWFIDYRDMRWKDSGHKLVGDMTFYPEKYKAYMHEIIDWLTLRPCARRRGLGTQFPFEKGWIIESLSDSTIYMAMYTIAHQLRDVPVDALEEAFFDYIFLGLGPGLNNANAENVAKELPVQISVDILNRLRKEFDYWYPNDLRHTAPPHLSNHLVFFLMHHAAIFPARHWPIAITLSELMIREGRKISKSKGNVIPLAHVSKLYGVDLYRLYCALNADFATLSNWREQDIDALRRRFNALITIFDESIETGTGAGAGAGVEADADALEEYEFTHTDRWLLSKFYRRLQESIERFDGFRIREAGINMVFNLTNDLRYYEKRESVERRRRIVRNILEDWLIILSPIVPHICEELWHKLKLRDRDRDRDMDQEKEKETFISRQALPGIKLKFIDEKVEREEEYLVSLVGDVQEILKITRITPDKIYIYTADAETERWKCELFKAVREIADKDKIKEAMKIQKDKSKRTETVSFVKQLINSKGKSRSKLEYFELNETEILRREKAYLAKEFGCEIGINEEHDPKGKKKFAIPLKPAIYVG